MPLYTVTRCHDNAPLIVLDADTADEAVEFVKLRDETGELLEAGCWGSCSDWSAAPATEEQIRRWRQAWRARVGLRAIGEGELPPRFITYLRPRELEPPAAAQWDEERALAELAAGCRQRAADAAMRELIGQAQRGEIDEGEELLAMIGEYAAGGAVG